MNKSHQRKGAKSNAHVGAEFECAVQKYFNNQGIKLDRNFPVSIGVGGNEKKQRRYDLGAIQPALLVECKSHTWTEGDKVPSAKMTTWNQEMYYFHLAPDHFRKILFVLKDLSIKRQETLAEYYVRTNSHLIPNKVEIWEFDTQTNTTSQIHYYKLF